LVNWGIFLEEFTTMPLTDSFSTRYAELLDGGYDCVDRIVLNGYVSYLQSGGGFRCWWREVFGRDDNLDNAHLMRWAGRFARRLREAAKQRDIPILEKGPDDRMHEMVQELRPTDPNFRGVFAISIHRAPNSVWGVVKYPNGEIHLQRKKPQPWVNHWAFHIIDPDWGHITIKVCPHPPFHVQVALNGHEYVARQAARQEIPFTKEANCFTDSPNLAGLEEIAETLRSVSAAGRLTQACERWLYSACLCYLMPVAEQQRLGLKYEWSVYQLELSRNLLFHEGQAMEEVFQSVIDRTRRTLDVRTIRTLFGNKKRPFFRRNGQPNFAVAVERPTYDLTVFKVHCGLLTMKIYTKGERVLRIEATVHNAKKEFSRGYGIARFAEIADVLRSMVIRFLGVLRSVDACWVSEILGVSYTPRQASYDLRKLRAKDLVHKIAGTRSYEPTATGLRNMVALTVLRDKVLAPLLSHRSTPPARRPRNVRADINQHYKTLQFEIHKLLTLLGIAV
jgi:hypothetical protein